MTCLARLLVVEREPEQGAESLSQKLGKRGYHVRTARTGVEALTMAAAGEFELAVIDADGADGFGLPDAIRRGASTGDMSVLMISGVVPPQTRGIDDVLLRPYPDILLLKRLEALVRLHVMRGEWAQRVRTSAEFGVNNLADADPDLEINDARVLLAGGNKSLIGRIASAVGGVADIAVAASPSEVMHRLLETEFDAVLAAVEDKAVPVLDTIGDIRRTPSLVSLPLMLFAGPNSFADPEDPFRAGADDVVYHPWVAADIARRTMIQIRQRRCRQMMRRHYRAPRATGTTDGLTGLYSHAFLHAHLKRLLEAARRRGTALSVGVLEIADIARINGAVGYVAGDDVLRQMGGLISALLRGQDLPARDGGNRFCVVLPSTGLDQARTVMSRLASVAGFTDFAVSGRLDSVKLHALTGCAAVEPDDTPEGMIARARADLQTRSQSDAGAKKSVAIGA